MILVVEGAHGERAFAQVDFGDVDVFDSRAETLGLLAKLHHKIGAHDPLGEPRIVFNLGRQHQLAAVQAPGQDQGLEIRTRRIHGGGQPGWAGPDDDDAFHIQRFDRPQGGSGCKVEPSRMTWPDIPLEDDFGDVLRKAMRGNGLDSGRLARELGVDARTIEAWMKYDGSADDAQARAAARMLKLDPSALADSAAKRWHPPHIAPADVSHHPQNPHPSNGYVFFLDGGRRAALIDPAGIPANLLRVLRDGDYHLQYILITHKHDDHCDATADVAKAFPQAQIVMHALDVAAIGSLASKAVAVRDGEELPFGDDVRIRMLHTPGHTDGSSSFASFSQTSLPAIRSSPAASAARSAMRAPTVTSSTACVRSSLPCRTIRSSCRGTGRRRRLRWNATTTHFSREIEAGEREPAAFAMAANRGQPMQHYNSIRALQ